MLNIKFKKNEESSTRCLGCNESNMEIRIVSGDSKISICPNCGATFTSILHSGDGGYHFPDILENYIYLPSHRVPSKKSANEHGKLLVEHILKGEFRGQPSQVYGYKPRTMHGFQFYLTHEPIHHLEE